MTIYVNELYYFWFQEQQQQKCHVRRVCLDARKENAYHRYGFATIKKTVKRAKMNFNHVVSEF